MSVTDVHVHACINGSVVGEVFRMPLSGLTTQNMSSINNLFNDAMAARIICVTFYCC